MFRDEMVQARAKPLVALNPGGSPLPAPRSTSKDVGVAPQPRAGGLLPEPYPETEEEKKKELERILNLLTDKEWGTEEQDVLNDIEHTLGVSPIDIWHGSHVVVQDGGDFYNEWKELASAQDRTSSHYTGVNQPQYEIDFPPHGALLFGLDADGNTWFQMENRGGSTDFQSAAPAIINGVTEPLTPGGGNSIDVFGIVSDVVDVVEQNFNEGTEALLHTTVDFGTHWASGYQNVGPFGLSPHSEKTGNQIIVTPP
jgi:hypothetical protein